MSRWSIEKHTLSPPLLDELVPPITRGLQTNFADVSVQVTACPDLRAKPFCLAAEGLAGNPRVADIGGPPNLAPTPKLDRRYALLEMAELMEMPQPQQDWEGGGGGGGRGFLLGAGAGPFHVLGRNSELMPNLSYEAETVANLTHYAKVDEGDETGEGCVVCEKVASGDCGLMANLFGSEGRPGNVLKIVAKTRTGGMNFTETIQKALKAEYGEQTVSLGGVFVIRKGKARLHVMPDFSKTPLKTREEVDAWLKYFDMSAPLVCLSVFHSHDPGLDLRMEHTHCFSDHNEGGHYHDDTTPEEVEYEAYFNVASVIYRIDRPGA